MRDVRVDRQLDLDLQRRLLLHPAVHGGPVVRHRLADHPDVQVEADPRDVAGLFTAEQVPRAADLQVLHRHVHARAHLGVLGDRRQTLVRGLRQRLLRRVQEVGVAPVPAAADTATQLVQLREPEVVAALHDQRVGVRDVDTGLDDRRRDQHVEPLLPEVDDDLLQLALAHLPVRRRDPRLGHDLAQPGRGPVDGLDPVVDVEDLSLTQEFTAHGRADLLLLVRPDEREDGVPLLRGRRDRRHLADARDGHFERTGDGGRRHREYVHVGPELLQLLLVLDTEALLLVDDDQTQVLELRLRREQPVRTDDQVHGPVLQPLQRRLRLGVGLEPAQCPHVDRELRVPLGERAEVLLDQERRRHEHRDLLAVLDRLEGRAHRDLRLAVPDVTADQPVHRDGLLHVLLDLGDRGQLVGRLGVREGVLQLTLPRGVRPEGVAGRRHARRVQLDQVGGDLLDRLLGPLLRLRPVGAAEPVQGRGLAADVLGDLLQLVRGDVEPVAGLAALGGGVLDEEVLAGRALHGALDHLDVPADPVLLVDDEVARLQGQRVDGLTAPRRHPSQVLAGGPLPGQVRLGQHGQLQRRIDEAVVDRPARDVDERGREIGQVRVEPGRDALAAQHLDRTGGRALPLRDVHRAPALGQPPLGVGERPGRVAPIRLRGVHPELQGVPVQLLVGGERRGGPPHHAQLTGPLTDVGDAPQGRRAHVDRGLSPARGGRPGRLEELLAGRHEVRRPRPHPLRVADQRHRALRQDVQQQLHLVDQHRGQRLHALDGDALGDLPQQLAQLRVRLGEGRRPGAHVLGEQQLTAGRGPQSVSGDLQGPLVGDLEVADLLDVVAPELDPEGVLLGRREDVQDPAAHGELPALLDQLHTGVRRCRERVHDLAQIRGLPTAQRHGLQVAEALDLRLEHGTHRCDDDLDRAGLRVVRPGVREPAQHGETAADGVGAGREPLVGQGLPGGELRHGVGGQQGPQGRGQVLGLAAGGGDGQHGASGLAGQRGHGEGACGGRADQVDVGPVAVGCGLHRFGERRVGDDDVQQTVQAHEGFRPVGRVSNAKDPTRGTGRGVQRTTPVCHSREGTPLSVRTQRRRAGPGPAVGPSPARRTDGRHPRHMDPPVRDVPVTHARTDGRTRSGPGRSEERPGPDPST